MGAEYMGIIKIFVNKNAPNRSFINKKDERN